MFHRIVVPLDGSELAERALEQAKELARLANVPVHLLRVVDLGRLAGRGSVVWGLTPWALQRALEEEQRGANEYLDRMSLLLKNQGVETTTEVRHGNSPDEIVDVAGDGDLVVMSTHGRSGVPRWYFGSVAEAVARHAPGPVMLIHSHPVGTDNLLQPADSVLLLEEMAAPA